jgi:hypothetical protein
MPLDPGAEAAAITADLRALAPEPTVVPTIKTSRPFHGARVGDLRALAALEPDGLEGAIVGKALYAGRFTVAEALALLGGGVSA